MGIVHIRHYYSGCHILYNLSYYFFPYLSFPLSIIVWIKYPILSPKVSKNQPSHANQASNPAMEKKTTRATPIFSTALLFAPILIRTIPNINKKCTQNYSQINTRSSWPLPKIANYFRH